VAARVINTWEDAWTAWTTWQFGPPGGLDSVMEMEARLLIAFLEQKLKVAD
jgi:hypothetical protein